MHIIANYLVIVLTIIGSIFGTFNVSNTSFFTKTRGNPPLLSDSVSGGMDSAIKLHIMF